MSSVKPQESSVRTVALIGPPNSGKSTVFNRLTGATQRVGNFPGVTVDRKEGVCRLDGQSVAMIDLPGLYSLTSQDSDGGLDHAVARDYLASGTADLVLNVADATRLEQSLYLTVQLLECGLPCVVAINLSDAAEDAGFKTDVELLSHRLGCPVLPIAAALNQGVPELKARVIAEAQRPTRPERSPVIHAPAVEAALSVLERSLAGLSGPWAGRSRRWLALTLLEGDHTLLARLPPEIASVVAQQRQAILEAEGEEADSLIAGARFEAAHTLAAATQRRTSQARSVDRTDSIDSVVLHPLLGIPVFLLVMYALFTFTINVGGAFIDFFDLAAGALFVDGFGTLLTSLGAPDWLRVLAADGLGGGIQVVATFIPVVGALYLALTLLEDSGYMARAAFVMDRAMNRIGLPGKAVVPLIVGFGCNVPSVMATRVLERPRDRALTISMAPFMSCGARLAVYALFVAAFFPQGGQNVVMGLYLAGVVVAVLTALILRKTLLAGESAPFMLELPSYRMPRLRDVLLHTWTRLKVFVVKAGQVIALVVMVLNVLSALGTDGRFDHAGNDTSILAQVSKAAAPAFTPMGVSEENWPAVVGIVTGLFAKEAVVGTLDALYTAQADTAAAAAQGESEATPTEEEGFDLVAALQEAVATIPENLAGVGALLLDPLGFEGLADPGVEETSPTLTALASGFTGALGALSYMLFVLLYVPCVAVLGAIRRELGWRWTGFVTVWTTGIAYAVATLTFQIGTFSEHPATSLGWIIGIAVVLAAVLVGLFMAGHRARGVLAPTLAREGQA
ncbi:Fe(2+) transporter permease subunit FeoB [Pararhodospirillum photometricum]|uniref:Ferrous iron transport protein B n=1 Tax=Pararhodospirillum photometricum DSM 122 TaxID=1150469 RepID=H6SRC1_PARPM|nr:Fe(2+) transporter permease subunit FeoB [Pararhodospirillum photometricum]CCG09843.1 Ferrous iron transport protein B [Pararhodospirillum photometricum DSM 122]